MAAKNIRNSVSSLWESDDFADIRKELEGIADGVGGISPEKIAALAEESEVLAEVLELDGMNATFLAKILDTMAVGGNGLELITGSALKLNEALDGMVGGFENVAVAKERYDTALSVGDYDANFRSMTEAFEVLDEEFTNGMKGSRHFWAAAELLFGSGNLEAWDFSVDKIYNAMWGYSSIFSDADSAGYGFLDKLYQLSEDGAVRADDGSVLAEINKLSDGSYKIGIDSDKIAELAKHMGLSEEAVLSCVEALQMFGGINFYNVDEVLSTIKEIGYATDNGGITVVNADELEGQLKILGKTAKEISDIKDVLSETENVKLLSFEGDIHNTTAALKELGMASEINGEIRINYESLTSLMQALGFTQEDATDAFNALGELDNVTFTSVNGEATDLNGVLSYVSQITFKGVEDSVDAVVSAVGELTTAINGLDGKSVSVTIDIFGSIKQAISTVTGTYNTITEIAGAIQGIGAVIDGISHFAGGTRGAPGGASLVGEEGEELVWSGDSAYFVGSHGPEIVNLNRGDAVYTAEKTAKIKRSSRFIRGRIPSYGGGVYGSINKRPRASVLNDSGSGSSSGNSSNISASSSSNSSSDSSDEESEFERLYKYHQHLVAMDKESTEDYLEWLNDAYQEAYKNNEIELDDYRKYAEEVYSGLKDLFKDYLSDVEHEISMRENYEGESNKILFLYKQLLNDVEKEIAKARDYGLDDNDDYIQELQEKWQDYSNSIEEIYEDIEDAAKDAFDELVDYSIDMITQETENEKEALEDRLDNLRNFYDKQKELLQDAYDEGEYLSEQAERRKTVADLRAQLLMLQNDDSAWAQKRRLELQDEISKADKELKDFENAHALDITLDALDTAYERQEAEIESEIEAIEGFLNDPEAIYNRALSAIQTNTKDLYNQMVEYNSRYGTGNIEDVKEIYEKAFRALTDYENVFDEWYKKVILPNSTYYEGDKGSWNKEIISEAYANGQKSASNSGLSGSSPNSSSGSSASTIANGTAVKIKDTATKFGSKSGGVKMASFVPGGSFTVYGTSGDQVLIGINGAYTGWVNKSDIVGYSSGTSSATGGLHEIDEIGSEYLFTSRDGSRYRVLNSGDKVLNAKASSFLYNFANNGTSILKGFADSVFNSIANCIQPAVINNEIAMGDIIIRGNADNHTVSEIRRAQRENLTDMLKRFNRLNR